MLATYIERGKVGNVESVMAPPKKQRPYLNRTFKPPCEKGLLADYGPKSIFPLVDN